MVSSDNDFTPLAIRLRESGANVIGVGNNSTLEAFKNACDEFILIEYITQDGILQLDSNSNKVPDSGNATQDYGEEGEKPTTKKAEKVSSIPEEQTNKTKKPTQAISEFKNAQSDKNDINEIHTLLKIASDKYQEADGSTNVAAAGQYIKRVKPDFLTLTYGYKKLPDLIKAFPGKYKMKESMGKGTVKIISYKCL